MKRILQKTDIKPSSIVLRSVALLMLLTCSLGVFAKPWKLVLVRVENIPDERYSRVDIQTGKHIDNTFPDAVTYTCTAPPKEINQGDEVILTLKRWGSDYVAFMWNHDNSGNPNPKYGEAAWYDSFKNVREEGIHDVRLLFDHPKLVKMDAANSHQAADGDEFMISYNSGIGETRWIYKYTGTGAADAPVMTGNAAGGFKLGDKSLPWAVTISIIGALLAILLGAGTGMNFPPEESEGNPQLPPRPSDRYVTVLPDGTIEYTNPITFEVDYLPPGSDEEAIREQVEHVLDNRDYYQRIQNQHDRWTAEQRAQQQRELAERRKEWEARLREQEAQKEALRKQQEAEEARKRARIERLMEEHGAGGEEFLRRNMIRDMGWDESRYWDYMSHSDGVDSAMHAVGFTKNSADVGMDVAAAVGGEKGEAIRDAYKVATEMAGTLADAHARGESLTDAAVLGLKRSAITLAEYHTTGKIHTATVIVGESARDIVTAYKEGKSGWEIFKAGLKGAGRGTKDAIVDHFTNKWSKIGQNSVTNNTGVGKTLSNAYDSKTAESVMKQAEAAGDDLGKIWGDKYFE